MFKIIMMLPPKYKYYLKRVLIYVSSYFLVLFFLSSFNRVQVCKPLESLPDSTACTVGMGVAFLIDYTNSMSPIIENIKTSVSNIILNIEKKSAGNYQLSLGIFDEVPKGDAPFYYFQSGYTSLPAFQKMVVTSGPQTSQILTVMEPFSYMNKFSFISQLNKLNSGAMMLGTGAGTPEPGGMLAFEYVNNNFAGNWRTDSKKICFIITDAPSGGNDDQADTTDDSDLQALANIANNMGVGFILITTLNSGSNYEVHLIDNNTGSMKFVNANILKTAEDINKAINDLCR